ncbi:MAG: M48 family metallopeptidase [Burkholderiaceae bacterium]|nr:M48 family metallopeptidase [Burkholderiaceae bacterium]
MSPLAFSYLFVAAIALTLALKLWLGTRQIRHVAAHRATVPAAFASGIGLAAHQRAADYTIARVRLALVESALGAAVVIGFTLLGGVQALHAALLAFLPQADLVRRLALIGAVVAIGGLIDLPLAWYRQFRLESRFGFNRMTLALWFADLAKGAALGAALGLPFAAAVLWLMQASPQHWWWWVWALWMAFNLFVLVLYPTVIAPLFNRFVPLEQGPVRDRVEALLARCGFRSNGLFVMDGSRRSAHGNAYFTGLGRSKRIVFFDTLLARLSGEEIEAVLAHELGHFRHRHIAKRIAASFALSLGGLAVLGFLAAQPWFFHGLGVAPAVDRDALALVLFVLALPWFTFALRPLASLVSRRHEFEADAFAAREASAADLAAALVKLYEDNAATLTPDPLHSAFYDSHPPAAQRIGRLSALAARA